jgi:hypothetical protein
MRPVYDKMKAATTGKPIPATSQVPFKIDARQDVPVNVSYGSMRVGGVTR